MRILNLISMLDGGGAERQLTYLAPKMFQMGHEAHIVYTVEHKVTQHLQGVTLHQLMSRSNYDPYLLIQLLKLVRRIKPDIIHTWILQMDILGGMLAKITKTPWIIREPSSAMAYPSTWKNSLRVAMASGANAIVSNSEGGDAYWTRMLPDIRRYVIRNGLPLDDITDTRAALPLHLPDYELPIVLYVGRLTADASATKNLMFFLKSLALVKQQKKIVGFLCGDGPQRRELEILRHTLGLDNDVHFTGHLPSSSVWSLMKSASVFVSISAFEGCPNTVMEAMACGCPLILSDIPSHREILNETCACFVGSTDIQQTADAILQTLFDSETAKKRALVAQQKAQQWSINEMARSYEKVYKELA
jgi:glycosyltransferase involved in cell wall biosynthesis